VTLQSVSLEAVLFDLDGVLVDSEPLWSIVEEKVTNSLGGTWSPDVKAAMLGKPLDVASGELLRAIGNSQVTAADVGRRLTDGLVQLFETDLELLPGATELLDALAAEHVPMAIVSSSSREIVDAALRVVGSQRFSVIVVGDEHDAHKPHPGPYLEAAARLAVDPRSCLAVEDSPTGIASAEAAGCVVVAVPNTVQLDPAPGRFIVRSLEGVTVDWLRAVMGA
jgi:HAD superfamily hydrolase (TIGR01509 family)